MKIMLGLGFNFGHSLTASFQRFALECIPGRFASAFRQAVADLRTNPSCWNEAVWNCRVCAGPC